VLPNQAIYGSPLIHAQTTRLLAATVLETFPNTTLSGETARAGGSDPSAVRRAAAFIDEHAGDPIGITEIAAAAGLGARTVQEAFRRHLDTTPMTYLRKVRLDRAHRDLQQADPDGEVTVADVAARWGFAHHGRFSAAYRAQFGCPPSRTFRS
jgi:transcriptional regulator GlxA family with amidase domain